MHYHAPSKQFTISLENLQNSANILRFAIKMIRQSADLPLEGGDREGAMTNSCHAEQAILDASRMLGIDLGATRTGQLNVGASE